MSETRTVTCPECKGEGRYETTHPLYGSRSCPEPWVIVDCHECRGRGEIEVEIEDDDMKEAEKPAA